MRAFLIVWFGQLVSMVGTGMTRFALIVWLWDRTQAAVPMTLMVVFAALPAVVLRLFAGVVVDRWDRRRLMIWGDLLAGLSTVALVLLYAQGSLQVWHVYASALVSGTASTFQSLAYTTTITTLIPKAHYPRASGLISLAHYATTIAAPLLAGLLITVIGVAGVLMIDVATFLFAVGTLLWVRFPPRARAEHTENGVWRNALFGFRYIAERPSLLGLLFITTLFTVMESLGYPLIAPLLLARTGGDEALLGLVQAVMGTGGVLGGAALVIWGGPKRRIHGLLIGLLLTGILGDTLMGVGQVLPVWLVAGFCLEVFIPMLVAANDTIWRSKVPSEAQGRVFATTYLLMDIGEPLATLTGGLLVDSVFEPALRPGGSLAPLFGGLVGTGPGAGMGLVLLLCGVLSASAGVWGYLFRPVRAVETLLPDYDSGAEKAA
ncbi:MAG: MFS transporter [Chloroflexi bacterium]|nr:MFS transporter [Chloroflexota bacterium]